MIVELGLMFAALSLTLYPGDTGVLYWSVCVMGLAAFELQDRRWDVTWLEAFGERKPLDLRPGIRIRRMK